MGRQLFNKQSDTKMEGGSGDLALVVVDTAYSHITHVTSLDFFSVN